MIGGAVNKVVNTTFRWAGLDKGQTSMGRLATGAAAAAAAIAAAGAALWALTNRLTQTYGEFDDMSARVGMAASQLHAMSYASEQLGADFEGMTSALRRMPSFLSDVDAGLSTATRTMEQLGVTAEDFRGMSTEQAFYRMVDALRGVDDEMTRAALAQDVFGRGAQSLMPLIEQGSAGLQQFTQEARDLGIVLDDETYAAADHFQDVMGRLGARMQGTMMTALEPMLPELEELSERMMTAATEAIPAIAEAMIQFIPIIERLVAVLEPASQMLGGIANISANWDPLSGRFGGLFGDNTQTQGSNLFEQTGVGGQITRLNMILDYMGGEPEVLAQSEEAGIIIGEGLSSGMREGMTEDEVEALTKNLEERKRLAVETALFIAEREQEIAMMAAEKQAAINENEAMRAREAAAAEYEARMEQLQTFADFTTDLMSNAWDIMFTDTRQGFDDMLKGMVMDLVKSGLLKLIKGAITGGTGFLF